MKNSSTIFLLFFLLAANVVSWSAIFGADQRTAQLAFLDVGQGSGVLIVGPRTSILYDTGPSGRRTIAELAAILPAHRRRLDLLVLSHADRDHYGGAFEIIRRYDIGLILTNTVPAHDPGWQELLRLAQTEQIPLIAVRANTTITTPTEAITVLNPPPGRLFVSGRGQRRDFDNPNSVVLRVIQKKPRATTSISALLAGDIDMAVERYLAQHYQLASDYLLIAHHGSRFSSAPEFLRAVQPRLAVIQAGQRNRYGHPTAEVLKRIRQAGIPAWRTDLAGRLVVQ